MTSAQIIHRLLFYALLEIRDEARQADNKAGFRLADLFHNVALQLERASQGQATYDEVLQFLEEQAKETGCEKWFEARSEQLAQRSAS